MEAKRSEMKMVGGRWYEHPQYGKPHGIMVQQVLVSGPKGEFVYDVPVRPEGRTDLEILKAAKAIAAEQYEKEL